MPENRTRETDASVREFLESVENRTRREDAIALTALMERVTGTEPKMWGPSIVGFGKYNYRYDSGREGEMLRVGFSPRKANLALYLIAQDDAFPDVLDRLGKYRHGGSCLYLNKLADVQIDVLEELVARSWQAAKEKYGEPEN
jgi:hypothetical protein